MGFEEAEVLNRVNKEEVSRVYLLCIMIDMDPREALLRYEKNKKTDKEADYFANVFKKNMPTPIYSKRTLEADIDAEAERSKKRVTLNH